MAWTNPRTWVLNEVVTSTLMNTHVRDNFNETAPAKVTAKGDLVAGTGANTIARVPVGTDGRPLIANSACNAGVSYSDAVQIFAGASRLMAISLSSGNYFQFREYPTDPYLTSTLIVGASVGKNAYLNFIEFPTAGRWMVGIESGNSELQFATGTPGGSQLKMMLSETGHIFLTPAACAPTRDDINGLEFVQTDAAAPGILMRWPGQNGSFSFGPTQDHELNPTDQAGTLSVGANGLRVAGIGGDSSVQGLRLLAVSACTNTTKSTDAAGAVSVEINQIRYNAFDLAYGTDYNNVANSNLFIIRNGTTGNSSGSTQFIFDVDGDMHSNAAVSASAYDLWDDSHLARALMTEIGGRNIVRTEFDSWVQYNRSHLESLGIASFEDGGVFVNWTQFSRVLAGAAWQTAACLMRIERDYGAKIAALESRIDTLISGPTATQIAGA